MLVRAKKTAGIWGSPCLVFAIVVTNAALVRMWWLQVHALWFDEAFSIYYIQKGIGAIWGADWLLEPTPPLYYSLLALWSQWLGQAEPILRLFSLLASSLAAGFIYLSGRRLGGERAGILASILWATLPLSIDYGLEIRAYALEFLEISALTFVFIGLLQDALVEQTEQAVVKRKMIAFFLIGLALSYTHVTGILAFGAYCAIAAAIFMAKRRDLLTPFCIGGALYFLALIPQIYASLQVMTGNAPTLSWLVKPGIMEVVALIRAMLVGNMSWGDQTARFILVIWLCVALLSVSRLRRNDGLLIATILGVSFLGFIFFLGFSVFQQAVLLNRTTLWMMIPALLFLSSGLTRFPRVSFALLCFLLLSANAVATKVSLNARADQRGDWRGIREVVDLSDPQSLIVTVDGELACEFHYVEPTIYDQMRLADLQGKAHFIRTQRVDLSCNRPQMMKMDEMYEAIKSGRHVWIVGRMPYYENGARMRQDVEQIRDILVTDFTEKHRVENYSFIAVLFQANGQ